LPAHEKNQTPAKTSHRKARRRVEISLRVIRKTGFPTHRGAPPATCQPLLDLVCKRGVEATARCDGDDHVRRDQSRKKAPFNTGGVGFVVAEAKKFISS